MRIKNLPTIFTVVFTVALHTVGAGQSDSPPLARGTNGAELAYGPVFIPDGAELAYGPVLLP